MWETFALFIKAWLRPLLGDEDQSYSNRGRTTLSNHDWKHIDWGHRPAVPCGRRLVTTTSTVPVPEFWTEVALPFIPQGLGELGETVLAFHQYAGHTGEKAHIQRALRFWQWVVFLLRQGHDARLTWECVVFSERIYQREKRWINPF
jgi:hypothetical protein